MKPITVKDYEEVADEFFAKYHFVAKELGENTKPEQVLKVMESLGGLVMKKRAEDQGAPLIGFVKAPEEEPDARES